MLPSLSHSTPARYSNSAVGRIGPSAHQKNALEKAQIFLQAIRAMSLADLASPDGKGGEHIQLKALLKMSQSLQEAFGAPDLHTYLPWVGKSVLFENASLDIKPIALPVYLPSGVKQGKVAIKREGEAEAIRLLSINEKDPRSLEWDGLDETGNPVVQGKYQYTLTVNDASLTAQQQTAVNAQKGYIEVVPIANTTLAYPMKEAGPAILHIHNASGNTIESVALYAFNPGLNFFELEGKKELGMRRFGAGRYTFSIELPGGERISPSLNIIVEGISIRDKKVVAINRAFGQEYDLEKAIGVTALEKNSVSENIFLPNP